MNRMVTIIKQTNLKIILVFISLIYFNNISFAQWQWQNPKPQGNDLNCVKFINSDTGYAVGLFGAIIKTNDGGISWTVENSTTTLSLTSISCVGSNIAYAVGGANYTNPPKSIILKTIDGGQSWTKQTTDLTRRLNSVYFINQDTGFAVSHDTILKTINGGQTWSSYPVGYNYLTKVLFTNNQIGYAIGGFGRIYRTTDCGNSWIQENVGTNFKLQSICFINDSIGYVGGLGKQIYKTTDNGLHWNPIPNSPCSALSEIFFLNDSIGWISSHIGDSIYKTTNNGDTWSGYKTNGSIVSFVFHNENNGIGIGEIGCILKTEDSGTNWELVRQGTINDLRSVFFITDKLGFAVGRRSILKTIDGGTNWYSPDTSISESLTSVYFINPDYGYAVGYSGVILKTTNGGNNWIHQFSGVYFLLHSIVFTDVNNGYAVGIHNTILKTTNGGANWSIIQTGGAGNFYSIFFTDSNHGYVVGNNNSNYHTILKTTNAGLDWSYCSTSSLGYLNSVFFNNLDTGYAVGGYGKILQTTDGGANWTQQNIDTETYIYFKSVFFIDSDTGYVVGNRSYKTIDAGNTWVLQNTCTNHPLNSIFFPNLYTGFIAGVRGTILKLSQDSIPTGINMAVNNPVHTNSSIFPNPLTTEASIKYTIPSQSFVQIKIFDYTGKLRTTLINEIKSRGSYIAIVNTSCLESGVYFYQICIGSECESKKMIVMKL